MDAALANLAEFSISVRELGRYAQNLGKDRCDFNGRTLICYQEILISY